MRSLSLKLLGGLLVSLLALLVLAQPAAKPKKYAFLVGVNQYKNRGFRDLDYAERDVGELAKLLRDGGYDIVLLTGQEAERDRILSSLDTLLKKVTKEDLLLLAFAGHGQQIKVENQDQPFFCPREAVRGDASTLVSLNEVLKQLNLKGAGRNLMLVDACRDAFAPNRGRGLDGDSVTALPKGTAVLFSCSDKQRAFESVKAGGGHGVFFHFVLEGLRGGAADAETKQTTWDDLTRYVNKMMDANFDKLVSKEERREGEEQHPHEVKNLAGRSPVLLDVGAKKTELPATLELDVGGEKIELVRIDPGTFTMGDDAGDSDEKPAHRVRITKPFYLGKYELTRGRFRAFVKDRKYETEAEKGNGGWGYDANKKEFVGRDKKYNWTSAGFTQTDEHPVVNVSWNDALAFCAWMDAQCRSEVRRKLGTGDWRVKLPTEAQWEFACRAGSETRYHFGNNWEELARYGNVADGTAGLEFPDWTRIRAEDGYVFAAPVGRFRANAWKLHDMHGNVWEWCEDAYDDQIYTERAKESPVNDPKSLRLGDKDVRRVLRGGSWYSDPLNCRAAARRWHVASIRYYYLGLRVSLRLD